MTRKQGHSHGPAPLVALPRTARIGSIEASCDPEGPFQYLATEAAALMPNEFPEVFNLRRAIARIGQSDWLSWWDCHALTPTGDYVVPRLFRRTRELSAAHVAFVAARAEHERYLPKERVVHLFDFGEAKEGAFERWLVARKRDGWTPENPLPGPTEESRQDTERALKAVGLFGRSARSHAGQVVLVETVDADVLENPATILELAHRLAGSYSASGPGRFCAPYARVRS